MLLGRNRKKRITDADLVPERIPQHVAIIMDGNGRWAKKRGLPRVAGHHAGVKTVDRIVEQAIKSGVKILTLYTFSSENWSRPIFEINSLMDLLHSNLISQREKLVRNGVQLRISGSISQFPEQLRNELDTTVKMTQSSERLILNLALGYSARYEILEACRSIAIDVKEHRILPEEITESLFSNRLYTAGLPDPELVIRTSGEYRLSNFLLWQSSYSEFYFTNVLWPDFTENDFLDALYDYQNRKRRFGGLDAQESES